MNQIIVIGTTPPCPRCTLLTEIIKLKTKLFNLDAEVRHISYTSTEAAEIADSLGLKPGTAKNVAELIGKELNPMDMPKSVESSELEFLNNVEPEIKKYEQLFREVNILDNWLRPFENQSKNAGILMTPALIINGKLIYNGSVPDLKLIDGWLSELK